MAPRPKAHHSPPVYRPLASTAAIERQHWLPDQPPPVYCPSSLAGGVQGKMQLRVQAPPVYRPQAPQSVAQGKPWQPGQAPPVYRPELALQAAQAKPWRPGQPPPAYCPFSAVQPKTGNSLPQQASRPLRTAPSRAIQRSAAEDLKSAKTNAKYLKREVAKAMDAGLEVIAMMKALPEDDAEEEAFKTRAAAGMKDFFWKYIDQIDARNTELLEVRRLWKKPGAKQRLAVLSADDKKHADIEYLKAGPRGGKIKVVKEVKTINSEKPGAIGERIRDAMAQLNTREDADKRKVLIAIENSGNKWPLTETLQRPGRVFKTEPSKRAQVTVAGGISGLQQEFYDAVQGGVEKLKLSNAVAIAGLRLQNVNVHYQADEGDFASRDLSLRLLGDKVTHLKDVSVHN